MRRETQASILWLAVLGVTLESLAGVEDQVYLPATSHSWILHFRLAFSEVHLPTPFSALNLIG